MDETKIPSEDVCNVVEFDVEKKEVQCQNKSGLNITHKATPLSPPEVVCAQKEHLD